MCLLLIFPTFPKSFLFFLFQHLMLICVSVLCQKLAGLRAKMSQKEEKCPLFKMRDKKCAYSEVMFLFFSFFFKFFNIMFDIFHIFF